jgi:ketosteroid isomerase-like protein
MSQADIEVVRRSIEVWSKGDIDALTELFTHDCVFHSAVTDLVGKTITGIEGLRRIAAQMADEWSAIRWEIDEIFEAENGIVTLHRVIGLGRTSGIETTRELAGLYQLRDGAISRSWIYLDRDEALRDAGPRKSG